MISTSLKTNEIANYRLSIAPMMDCTDRHFRVLMRQITKKSLLYTETIVAQALHYSNNRNKLLDFDEIELLSIRHKPKLIIAGGSAYPRIIDFNRFRKTFIIKRSRNRSCII